MAVVYASYSLRTGEVTKESVVRESTELAVDKPFEGGESMAMTKEFYEKQPMSDVFIVLFVSSPHF